MLIDQQLEVVSPIIDFLKQLNAIAIPLVHISDETFWLFALVKLLEGFYFCRIHIPKEINNDMNVIYLSYQKKYGM